jgi:hypothetical protein
MGNTKKKSKFICNTHRAFMAEELTKQQTIDQIVKEARKLDKLELQILLSRLRIKKMAKEKRKPVANYDPKKIKAPSLDEINTWTHEARKQHASKKVRSR